MVRKRELRSEIKDDTIFSWLALVRNEIGIGSATPTGIPFDFFFFLKGEVNMPSRNDHVWKMKHY